MSVRPSVRRVMHDGMPYGRIQGQGQGHEPIQGSRIENLQSREVDRQSPMGLIFKKYNSFKNILGSGSPWKLCTLLPVVYPNSPPPKEKSKFVDIFSELSC